MQTPSLQMKSLMQSASEAQEVLQALSSSHLKPPFSPPQRSTTGAFSRPSPSQKKRVSVAGPMAQPSSGQEHTEVRATAPSAGNLHIASLWPPQ
ncbi:hypothetical protein BE04_00100 [Sorangium cellulosum]|uniref:Uncharacterized protein n=1 Tax=Sorangium cellulosum TaxID=56 RepID=A0A150PUZ9_SORCE|nr:hypothetical protein BE04_00100 [Sorangium cellulosum]